MISLRNDVERVVRPIRARTRRKNQMRDELLAHLEGLLAEEKARGGDDDGAVRRARARFGEPGQLATELQATVPRWERWAFVPLPGLQRGRRRPGETLGAYQRRWIVRMTCLVLVWGGFAVGCALVGPRRIELTGFFLVQVLVCTLLLGLGLLAEAIRRSLMRLESADPAARRTAWRAVAFGALAAALLTGSITAVVLLLFDWSAQVPLIPPRILWGVTLMSALVMLPVQAALVRSNIAQVRQFDQWDGLDLSLDA
ncbi:MAG: permease prefix domain 1-containing protein [Isosphaeraceae bacterium]